MQSRVRCSAPRRCRPRSVSSLEIPDSQFLRCPTLTLLYTYPPRLPSAKWTRSSVRSTRSSSPSSVDQESPRRPSRRETKCALVRTSCSLLSASCRNPKWRRSSAVRVEAARAAVIEDVARVGPLAAEGEHREGAVEIVDVGVDEVHRGDSPVDEEVDSGLPEARVDSRPVVVDVVEGTETSLDCTVLCSLPFSTVGSPAKGSLLCFNVYSAPLHRHSTPCPGAASSTTPAPSRPLSA